MGIDSLTDYYDPSLKRANLRQALEAGLEYVEADLNTYDLDELVDDADVVVHLAGQPGVRKSWGRDFAVYTENNVNATQRLLEACVKTDRLRRFVYASSSSVYGEAESFPTHETAVPAPFSPYGVTKLAGEHLVGLYRSNYGLPGTSFRFFTVYGPGQRPDMAFTRFLRAAKRGEPISVFGDGEQVRDFTYVDDIVMALLLAAEFQGELPGVMNLSGGSSTTVNEVLSTISELRGSPIAVEYLSSVDGDVRRTGGDSSLAQASLGWKPTVALRDGIERQYLWVDSLDD